MAKKTSKHKKKSLKKKQRGEIAKKQRARNIRKQKIKKSRNYSVGIAGAIIAIFLIINYTGAEPGDPAMEVSPGAINLGDVGISGGKISATFEIKNIGGGDLIIDDMETSCGCTSAQIIYDEKEGPLFNMRDHGTNPTYWSVEIKPGDTAYLKVIYDPLVHSNHRGQTTRFVTLYSNDPVNRVQDAYIKLNQVD